MSRNEDEGRPLRGPFLTTAPSIRIQSVLYQNSEKSILRSLDSLERLVELEISSTTCSSVTVAYGDCSPAPCLADEVIERLRMRFGGLLDLEYHYFGQNLGSAKGHNTLAELGSSDFLLIQNPDVVVSPRLLTNLLDPFRRSDVGMVEAKQLPIEHPKEYNRATGETSWATTACAMIPRDVFDALTGFDADSFFLYCDDVDFSWRVREAGLNVIFQPSAVVFHDKRLSDSGAWLASSAEHYYSAEAALLMAHKWSRKDLVEKYFKFFRDHGDAQQKQAAAAYEKRKNSGKLPRPRDSDHKIGTFVEHFYAQHRYAL